MSIWIESHVEMGEHPKIYTLSSVLNIRRAEAVGLLHMLWHFTMKFAWRDGDLTKFDAIAIARGSGWETDPDQFIKSLQEAKFMDGKRVHDWKTFAGRLIRDRLYKEAIRDAKRTPGGDKKTPKCVTNPTNPTNPTEPTLPTKKREMRFEKPTATEITGYAKEIDFNLDGQKFWDYYESKGWVVGKSPMKNWKACVRTWKANGNGGRDNGVPRERRVEAGKYDHLS